MCPVTLAFHRPSDLPCLYNRVCLNVMLFWKDISVSKLYIRRILLWVRAPLSPVVMTLIQFNRHLLMGVRPIFYSCLDFWLICWVLFLMPWFRPYTWSAAGRLLYIWPWTWPVPRRHGPKTPEQLVFFEPSFSICVQNDLLRSIVNYCLLSCTAYCALTYLVCICDCLTVTI